MQKIVDLFVRPRQVLRRPLSFLLMGSLLLSGCSTTQKKSVSDLQYLKEGSGGNYYRNRSTAIEYPCLDNETAQAVQVSHEPRSLQRRTEDSVRDITLSECIRTALSQNDIIETSALGGVGSKLVLSNPEAVSSVYDASIQETGVLFGRRGLDAALSDFDATFASGVTWGRNSQRLNVLTAPVNTAETAAFNSSLSKSFATGAAVSVGHNWNYLGTNDPAGTALFPSVYTGNLGFSARQPLLAGSGVDFTRVAGPINPNFGSITGVSQGVVIARINQDITLADCEIAVQNAVLDIENAYWDLYLAYRTYDTAVEAHKSAIGSADLAKKWVRAEVESPVVELQALDQLYETKAGVETSLNNLYRMESELRRLTGMPMNDGTVLRPSDKPMLAEFIPDWRGSVTEALTQRVELRRQKWQIKSLQLQLNAARSLVRPRLDAVSSYDVNGFGDRLLGQNAIDPGTGLPIQNGFGSMTNDDLSSWTLGMQFSMPIGLRQARSQVRNYELQLSRANGILASQERNIAHDIATAIQNVTASWTAAQSNLNRVKAASGRLDQYQIIFEAGTLPRRELDLVLRAQSSLAAAESAFFQQVAAYNKAIASLHLATGSLLDQRHIWLAEGRWVPEAYGDAALRAAERHNGTDNPNHRTSPPEFTSPGPAGTVELQTPDYDLPQPLLPESEAVIHEEPAIIEENVPAAPK
ncbi:MAG: TolC family protein [Planctomyces sp.]